ncbi:GNAT family N-acetyltransferase [Enterococcus faecalis]
MIRLATKEDGAAIAALVLVILKDMELPLLKEVPEATVLSILSQAVADPNYRYGYRRGLVYEVNGQVAGIAFGYPAEAEATIDQPLTTVLKAHGLSEELKLFDEQETLPDEWYLDSISVAENYRGLGIGSKLLTELPKLARKDGKKVIGLNVDAANPDARRLYERHGFKEVGQLTISAHLYDHMQKQLD